MNIFWGFSQHFMFLVLKNCLYMSILFFLSNIYVYSILKFSVNIITKYISGIFVIYYIYNLFFIFFEIYNYLFKLCMPHQHYEFRLFYF